jgi:hypothetical protein
LILAVQNLRASGQEERLNSAACGATMFTVGQPDHTQRIQAITYARVSSKEQEKVGFSIAAQQLRRQYASELGFDLVREFVDVETAKRAGRTGFLNAFRTFSEQK